MVLDLEGVTQMNAAGLGELVSINGAVRAFKGQLSLSAVPGRLRYLLAVTGLAPFFETLESEARAVEAARPRPAAWGRLSLSRCKNGLAHPPWE